MNKYDIVIYGDGGFVVQNIILNMICRLDIEKVFEDYRKSEIYNEFITKLIIPHLQKIEFSI